MKPPKRLNDVIHTIRDHAFVESQYPVIIAIEHHCNIENQVEIAKQFKCILGESLLTQKVDSTELELPSPEKLKQKFILMMNILSQ